MSNPTVARQAFGSLRSASGLAPSAFGFRFTHSAPLQPASAEAIVPPRALDQELCGVLASGR